MSRGPRIKKFVFLFGAGALPRGVCDDAASYNEVVGGFGGLLTTHGFQFATAAEVGVLAKESDWL